MSNTTQSPSPEMIRRVQEAAAAIEESYPNLEAGSAYGMGIDVEEGLVEIIETGDTNLIPMAYRAKPDTARQYLSLRDLTTYDQVASALLSLGGEHPLDSTPGALLNASRKRLLLLLAEGEQTDEAAHRLMQDYWEDLAAIAVASHEQSYDVDRWLRKVGYED